MKALYDKTQNIASNQLHGGTVGQRSTLQPSLANGVGALSPLLYHSDHNSAQLSEKKAYKPTNKQSKTFKVLDMNAKNWMKIYGKEKIGILTLTFKENLTCMKEAQRRWNSFSRQFNKHDKFQLLVKVAEPQKRGAVHYHCLIKTQGNIRGNIDWEIYEKMGKADTTAEKRKLGQQLGKSATSHLVELWSWLRKTTKATGFGRTELMPLKKPDHIKNYIGKYLEKDMKENSLKQDGKNSNMRLITYGKNAPKVANQQFSWVNGKASIFRRKLKTYCEARGIKDKNELVQLFGKSWSFNLYKDIMNDRVLGMYQDKKFNELQNPNERNKSVYPWKGQILSGAFSTECIERISEEYLNSNEDEQGRGSNLSTEYKRLNKWQKASHAKVLHQRVYGD
jgi:hypothetical protein